MSTSVRSFDRITIAAPCDADWDSMTGNDQVRFCEHCQLHVTNLSAMTRPQAMRFVAKSRGRLCIRYVQRTSGEIITKQLPQKLHHIGRRVSRIAAGAFSAALTVGTAAAQTQSDAKRNVMPAQTVATTTTTNDASIGGVVKDPNGALVPQAAVTLTNPKTNTTYSFITGDDGAYRFSLLEPGSYNLSVDAPGFSVIEKQNLELVSSANKTIDVDLAIAIITADVEVRLESREVFSVTMGVVAMREPVDPLIKAASKNDLDAVKQLLHTANDIDKWDDATGVNALAYAIENHNREMVKLLFSAGATANSTSRNGFTPIMYLNDGASAELVHDLVLARADVNARDQSGDTVLMHVISTVPFTALKELVEAGARIDAMQEKGNTLLMSAVENDDPQVVKFLLSAGVDIDARNENGDTAVTIAARNGKSDNLKTLIDAGGTFSLKVDELNDLLAAAVENSNATGAVKILLNSGANIAARDDDGTTLIMVAAKSGHADVVKLLIDQGADLNAVDNDGWTALMHADDVDTVRVLVDAGADMTLKNKAGKTALALAIDSDEPEIVKLLRSRGAPE
ncbi:MAG TPA: ankyrin repeat domain-containing protein [Pyrinomonadaceae bacterium]|nr:ankyrin repeat domain-containing protein [Pyrinomonadaceae bacterium]